MAEFWAGVYDRNANCTVLHAPPITAPSQLLANDYDINFGNRATARPRWPECSIRDRQQAKSSLAGF